MEQQREIILMSYLQNVGSIFGKAKWKRVEMNKSFKSVKELSGAYPLINCNYKEVVNGRVIRATLNGCIDRSGRRYRV